MELTAELAYEIEDRADEIGFSICASLNQFDHILIHTIDDDCMYYVKENGIFEAKMRSNLSHLSGEELTKLALRSRELPEVLTMTIGRKIGNPLSAKQIVDVINNQ